MLNMEELLAQKECDYYSKLADKAKYNKEAFEELYEHFFPRLYGFIYGRVKNADMADDLISVVFEKIFFKLESYDNTKGAFSTWVFRIASNEINTTFRQNKSLNETSWEDFFDPADERYTPEQQMLSDEGDKHLLLALDRLNDRECRIVSLKYFTGISNKEIAELENMTANNVGVVLHRSLDKLRNILEESGYTI